MFSFDQDKKEITKICKDLCDFEYYRLVDPYTHDVFRLGPDLAVQKEPALCYTVWGRTTPCANCTSLHACTKNTSFFKIEYKEDKIFMVNAKPVQIGQHQYSLELLVDVTTSLFVADGVHDELTNITGLIGKVNHIAIHDSFSGLYNRDYMVEKISYLACNSPKRPISVMVLDLDRFKQINDLYGHLIGDSVIKKVSQTLQALEQCKGVYVGRMGGDEFCIIFEGYQASEAKSLTAPLILAIKSEIYHKNAMDFCVDISIGLAQYEDGEDVMEFIDRTDRKMYEHKKQKAGEKS